MWILSFIYKNRPNKEIPVWLISVKSPGKNIYPRPYWYHLGACRLRSPWIFILFFNYDDKQKS